MGQLYEKGNEEDGFLFMAYSGENTLASETLASAGAQRHWGCRVFVHLLLEYLVNNWLFSVTPPEPLHRPATVFATEFIS